MKKLLLLVCAIALAACAKEEEKKKEDGLSIPETLQFSVQSAEVLSEQDKDEAKSLLLMFNDVSSLDDLYQPRGESENDRVKRLNKIEQAQGTRKMLYDHAKNNCTISNLRSTRDDSSKVDDDTIQARSAEAASISGVRCGLVHNSSNSLDSTYDRIVLKDDNLQKADVTMSRVDTIELSINDLNLLAATKVSSLSSVSNTSTKMAIKDYSSNSISAVATSKTNIMLKLLNGQLKALTGDIEVLFHVTNGQSQRVEAIMNLRVPGAAREYNLKIHILSVNGETAQTHAFLNGNAINLKEFLPDTNTELPTNFRGLSAAL